MNNFVAEHPRTSARERLRDWRPAIRHEALKPGESLPPGPRTSAALQSLRVWGGRNSYFPAMRERYGDTFSLNVAPVNAINPQDLGPAEKLAVDEEDVESFLDHFHQHTDKPDVDSEAPPP